jgi:diguanylate cyclase (GGDEF)-like protein
MLQSSASLQTRPADYVLIAIANTSRAASVRALALDFCPSVVVVRDGQDAVQHIDRTGPPRLLVTELSLPRLDGFGLLRHLRRTASAAHSSAIVVSAHESFRQIAQQMVDSLGISKIYPLDVDRSTLRRAMSTLVSAEDVAPPAHARALASVAHPPADEPLSIDERVNRALFELTRQFHVPIAAAYLQVRGQQRFVAYVSVLDASTSLAGSVVSELLTQAAASEDPLIVPSFENHPLFTPSAVGPAVRGFAGAPLVAPGTTVLGALGLFDIKPLTMAAMDIDTFSTRAQEVAAQLAPLVAPKPTRVPEPIERDLEALEQLAATDPLTGLANRRGGEKSIASEISRAERERKPLSCILLDIDRFKQVNDTLGHQVGDQVLRELSAMLRRAVRAYDIVARWGGEEFLLVLPGADLQAARLLAERIRVGVQKLPMPAFGNTVTISAGAAEFDSDYDFESTLRTADRRMYEAKAAGRNCVV